MKLKISHLVAPVTLLTVTAALPPLTAQAQDQRDHQRNQDQPGAYSAHRHTLTTPADDQSRTRHHNDQYGQSSAHHQHSRSGQSYGHSGERTQRNQRWHSGANRAYTYGHQDALGSHYKGLSSQSRYYRKHQLNSGYQGRADHQGNDTYQGHDIQRHNDGQRHHDNQ